MKVRSLFRRKKIQDILAEQADIAHGELHKNLSLLDLTAFGIAAIVGAGIFSTIGNASASGGPAVVFLFIFTAIACGFSAMCYAEFASSVPVSGSAYTYAYTSFGELVAWIIGWNLLMEYAIGNIAVAISWSDYFTGLMAGFGWEIPHYFSMDYLTAARTHTEISQAIAAGKTLNDFPQASREAYLAWQQAPSIGGFRIIADIPALAIVCLITYLVYIGMRETKRTANLMVLFKLAVILAVIAVGAFYVQTDNWSPFAPNGIGGVLKGVSAVFFAYIGFDAISTTAEECKNPQKDLPRSMFLSLLICTILYVLIALILTGVVPYQELAVGDPLAHIFSMIGLNFMSGLVALSAIIAIAGVLLVFQMGQPRIWMVMSRDGLMPPKFAKIHPKYKTPSFSTVVTGLVVAIPALFMNLTEVTDLTSIGTLFAFVIVCGGVLYMEQHGLNKNARFKIPYISSRWIVPSLLVGIAVLLYVNTPESVHNFLTYGSWESFKQKIPMWGFILVCIAASIYSIALKPSLIPMLGLLCNLYLMTELGLTNWTRFLIWTFAGMLIYFGYSYRHSKLAKQAK
ncbi:MAG: amino acid permease [Cytophagales bacterium]|nr:amino acid permease [Bernardetiaceae bacterium]MDW8203956.1 amino acid permease [Cytophagales bacterium]